MGVITTWLLINISQDKLNSCFQARVTILINFYKSTCINQIFLYGRCLTTDNYNWIDNITIVYSSSILSLEGHITFLPPLFTHWSCIQKWNLMGGFLGCEVNTRFWFWLIVFRFMEGALAKYRHLVSLLLGGESGLQLVLAGLLPPAACVGEDRKEGGDTAESRVDILGILDILDK